MGGENMYRWRKLTPEERERLLATRKQREFPWHRPPHVPHAGGCYHITAACYEHEPHVGTSVERMEEFTQRLLGSLQETTTHLHAWCVLPNHYHLLVTVVELKPCLEALKLLHGRTSFDWNGEDDARGRKVWSPPADRVMRSENHFWATINYVHHNPVRHGYVEKWQDWPFSSVHSFLDTVGRGQAEEIWKK